MNKIKNGKMPLSKKSTVSRDLMGDTDHNFLTLDPIIVAELKEKNLAYRFIDAKKYQSNYGFHRSGWTVYKRAVTSQGSLDFAQGTDPEGYVRRGDLVLATKPMHEAVKQKRNIQAKTDAYTPNGMQKQKARELREMMGAQNEDVFKVHEGYEENGAEQDEE